MRVAITRCRPICRTIVAKSITNHQSGALKDTIKRSTHDNYVGPWFSTFLKHRGL